MNLDDDKKIINRKLNQEREIPKIIHQIWIGPNPVPYVWINTWRFDYIKNNPEWKYILWNDENIKDLKYLDSKRYYEEKTWNGKSDFLRFAILKEFGGVYIDADSVSIDSKSLNPLLEQANGKFFAAWEDHSGAPGKTIAGGVCGCPKYNENTNESNENINENKIGHPVVNNIISVQNENWDKYNTTLMAWQTVGPLAVQKGIEKSDENQYIIFPSKYFYPEWWHHYSDHFTTKDMKQFPDSYMYQFGYSTNGYANSKIDLKDSSKRFITSVLINPDLNKLGSELNNPDLNKLSSNILETNNPDNLLHSDIKFDGDIIVVDKENRLNKENIEKEVDNFINSTKRIHFINKNSYITHSVYIDEIKKIGFTFLIRAKNEEKNIDICIKSLLPILKPNIEIVFVDNDSTDQTFNLALKYSDKIKVFKYTQPIAKTGIKYLEDIRKNPEKSIAIFYNWCVSKATKNIIIKWDADFILNLENFKEMEKMLDRNDNFVLWFTGQTIFEHRNKWYKKKNSKYDEFRVFNKNYSKWEDGIKCETLQISPTAERVRYEKPVFYEVKRTSLDEFSTRGDIIDNRDTEDKIIIDKIRNREKDDSLYVKL